MEQPSLRDRLAPWLPYWPWAVIPTLLVAIGALAAQNSALSRRLEIVRDDVRVLQQQVAGVKRSRSAEVASGLLAGLSSPSEEGAAPRHARAQRGEGRHRSGASSSEAKADRNASRGTHGGKRRRAGSSSTTPTSEN